MLTGIAVAAGTILGIGLLLLGLEIAIALGVGSLAMLYLIEGPGSLRSLGFIAWGSLNSATLSALPLFVLMAEFLLKSGVSSTFYDGMTKLVRRLPGGLLQTNIAGSALFAAICGSSVATAAAIGGVAIPKQRDDGYDAAMSCGSVAAGGTLGILIPPSLVMIIYSTFTEVSVLKLFTAGIIPGLLLTLIFMVYIGARAILDPKIAPPPTPAREGDIRTGLVEVAPVLLLMGFVLGSIYTGYATPTEAAGVGALAAMIVGYVVGRPPIRVMLEAILSSVIVSASILFIALSAFLFAYAVETTGLGRLLAEFVLSLDLNVYVFLLYLMIFYFIMGCLVDPIGMILLTVPLLLPILTAMNIDLIWFGVMLVVVVELGLLTPPVGINLFVVDSIAKVGIGTVIRGVYPYFFLIGLFLLLLTIFPQLATWLPAHL